MSEPKDNWQKLARLARQAPQPGAAEVPFGFATRVAARWASSESPAPSAWEVWEQFSLRGLMLASVLVVAVAFTSYDLATPGWTQAYTMADAVVDPIFEE